MSIDQIRAKALTHNSTITWSYPVCLDRDRKKAIDDATQALTALQEEKARAAQLSAEDAPQGSRRRSIASVSSPLDRRITDAEDRLQALEDAVPDDDLIVLVFGRITPDAYQAMQGEYLLDGKQVDLRGFWPALAAACYRRTETKTGEDLTMSWDEVRDGALDSQDMDFIYMGVTNLHRAGSTIPFDRKSSGAPATS